MRRYLLAVPLLAVLLAACDKPLAWGEWDSIIVGTSPERWGELEQSLESVFEARVQTVRPEKTFLVTHQDPLDRDWQRLQRFRQILMIGSQDEPWIAEALDLSDRQSFSPPEVVQVEDVWARGQLVTVLVTTPDGGADEVAPELGPLHELLDGQYREWVVNRMFMTGRDTALADTLWRESSFALVVPEVYYWLQPAESIFIFRNDNPDPSELIRQVTVSWLSPIPSEIDAEGILAWRQEISDEHFSYPQALDLSNLRERRLRLGNLEIDELRAVWTNPPDDPFPAGGPMITRWIACPQQDRLYLVDAWLYAPSKKKYQYMLQLETILDSFRCAPLELIRN